VIGAKTPLPVLNKNLMDLETSFQQNALKAEDSLKGRIVKLDTYVISVDKVNGKPHIAAGTVFDNDVTVYSDVYIQSSAIKTASDLAPKDKIQITGLFVSRVVQSKDVLEGSGYMGSVSNGYGGGGSSYVGTKTPTWTLYRFDNATIKIVEKEVDRAKKEAENQAIAAANEKAISESWTTARDKLDKTAAKKAFDLGLNPKYVDDTILEITQMDPKLEVYDQVVDFYKFLLSSGKADIGKAIFWSTGQFDAWIGTAPARPRLFKIIVDMGLVKLDYKFPNGDNWLLFFIKDQTLQIDKTKPTDRIRTFFNNDDMEFVRILAQNPECKGMADIKDTYGKTAKDYVTPESIFIQSESDQYKTIRELIRGMK